MKVVITGGGGFLGQQLARALLARTGAAAVEELVLFDLAPAAPPKSDRRVRVVAGDITDPRSVAGAIGPGTDAVFHLAAVVSAAAEADFDLGMRVNVDGTRHMLEAARALTRPPRIVFASSVAVYGGELGGTLDETRALTPRTSYGTQKAICELLVSDYTRKGFIDGRSLRLPTVVVRPGKPNMAASGFASNILRGPLAGREAICPVSPASEMWILSPRKAVAAVLHAFELGPERWEAPRVLNLPGITVGMGAAAEALARVAGKTAAGRIQWRPDPRIQGIVDGWPRRLDDRLAQSMGFEADRSIDDIIRAHIEDELGGNWAA